MIQRLCKLSQSKSFFLFGPRGTGKSTLLRSQFNPQNSYWIDLLNPDIENRYRLRATSFREDVLNAPKGHWIVIDEVQKVPKLLDLVHQLIEEKKIKFALTGSSARKLKRGAANLLAGRANVFYLHPFSYFELNKDLFEFLKWGGLPGSILEADQLERKRFLRSYCNTYLKEEIQLEQIVRNIEPFLKFLPVAASQNGKILNFSSVAREAGVDAKSIERYYQILEDTLVSFRLPAFHRSIRKQQAQKSKFYFFDLGVVHALLSGLEDTIREGTSAFGQLFEQFIILECFKLNHYFETDYRFSYLLTKDGAEIDLIVQNGNQPPILIEIKSKTEVHSEDLRHLRRLGSEFKLSKKWVISRVPKKFNLEDISIFPWQDGLKELWPKLK